MKILTLIIKQKYFDAIIKGEKKQEFREVRPSSYKRLLEVDSEGECVVDNNNCAITKHYDAIRFFVGYNKDRDSALVEVKGSEMVLMTDEEDNIITYIHDGSEWAAAQVIYDLGKIIEVKQK